MPPPMGVVSGPLIPMRCERKMSTVSSGSQLPVSSKAFCPANTSFQATERPCRAAAASSTSLAAGQMSTPVPSPSMKGMIGSSGTARVPSSPMRMRSAMDGMLRGGATTSQLGLLGSRAAARYPQQTRQAGVLCCLRTEDLTHPGERPHGVHLGAPAEDLLNVEPVLCSVENGLAHDEMLRGENRDVDGAETDHAGELGHFEVQVHGGEEHIEVRTVPVQPRLAVPG